MTDDEQGEDELWTDDIAAMIDHHGIGPMFVGGAPDAPRNVFLSSSRSSAQGGSLKLRMSKNSLFALLLRSPWWVSAAIALVLVLFGLAVLTGAFRVMAVLSGMPFAVIAAVAAHRQWHLPGTARVAETREALAGMPWPAFADLLEQSFRREGYSVTRRPSGPVDFELDRHGRRTLVSARRWKSARTGLEPMRALQAARDAADPPPDGLYIGLGPLTETALPFATAHGIAVWNAGDLARALRGLLGGTASKT